MLFFYWCLQARVATPRFPLFVTAFFQHTCMFCYFGLKIVTKTMNKCSKENDRLLLNISIIDTLNAKFVSVGFLIFGTVNLINNVGIKLGG